MALSIRGTSHRSTPEPTITLPGKRSGSEAGKWRVSQVNLLPSGDHAMSSTDPLLAPMKGAEHREIGGVQIDMVRTGSGRVKRIIYPAGFRWSTDMKPIVGTDLCEHA